MGKITTQHFVEVRCCCSPMRLLGWVEHPPVEAGMTVSFPALPPVALEVDLSQDIPKLDFTTFVVTMTATYWTNSKILDPYDVVPVIVEEGVSFKADGQEENIKLIPGFIPNPEDKGSISDGR